MKKFLTTEKGLLIESLIAVHLLNYVIGFEMTVLTALAFMTGHIVKMSWKKE